ncbi:AraC family ligand binding domain-containing protein [Kitasatospora herbaricolor]|uniref:AraC family ligand binding domain-containing protein n=1 Tax=Kitasatospora herbaricolor TaxID=68217 RepID=UPI0035226122
MVTEGAGSHARRGTPGRHGVSAGSFRWLPPGVPHTYGPTPGTWSEYRVLFEGPATGRYEDLGHLAAGPALVEPADPAGTRAALDTLLERHAAGTRPTTRVVELPRRRGGHPAGTDRRGRHPARGTATRGRRVAGRRTTGAGRPRA